MNRRDFVKTATGAVVGTAAAPVVLQAATELQADFFYLRTRWSWPPCNQAMVCEQWAYQNWPRHLFLMALNKSEDGRLVCAWRLPPYCERVDAGHAGLFLRRCDLLVTPEVYELQGRPTFDMVGSICDGDYRRAFTGGAFTARIKDMDKGGRIPSLALWANVWSQDRTDDLYRLVDPVDTPDTCPGHLSFLP